MRNTIVKAGLCLLALAVLPLAARAESFEGLLVARIELKGNVNTDSTLIKAQMTTKVRDKFSLARVSQDVKDLYFLGYFSDIRVEAQRVADGVVLAYSFVEYEKVDEIVIKGADELSESDVRDVMTIKKDSVYNKVLLQKNLDAILDKYKEKGFINAKVRQEVKIDEARRRATVILVIEEGSKIVIEKIAISGCKQLEEGAVKGALEDTHESGFFRGGIFDEKAFEKDKERIVKYYKDRGFLDMQIKGVDVAVREVEPGKPKKAIFLTIKVEEGQRFRAGDFTFRGNEVYSSTEILKDIFRLKKGEYFDSSKFDMDLMTLWQGYREKGYIFANIVPVKTVDRTNSVVHVAYAIHESDKAHVESIRIKGTDRTRNYVVEREIRLKEGEVFNSSKIRRSQERLFNTRFFKDVNIEVEPGSAEGLMNLVFSLKEDRTGLFTLGGGFGTVTGFTFYEQITENNLFGMGLSVHERFEIGQKRTTFEIGIDTPYLLRFDPTSAGFSISYNRIKVENIPASYIATNTAAQADGYNYWRKSFEIQLRLGRAVSEYWRLYGSYTFAWLKNYDANFNSVGDAELAYRQSLPTTNVQYINPVDAKKVTDLRDSLALGFSTKSSFRTGGIYDSRDYVGGPSRGIYLSQFLTYTGGVLGGDSRYILSDLNFSFYVPLFWSLVFAVDTKFEFMFNQLDGSSRIYPGDYLKFDGMTELRGWRDYDIDGRSKIATLLEIRYPIDRQMLWGVLFWDTGRLWEDHTKTTMDLTQFKHSVGFGFRLQIAVLPIRLYFAKRFELSENAGVRWEQNSFWRGWETVFSVAGIF